MVSLTGNNQRFWVRHPVVFRLYYQHDDWRNHVVLGIKPGSPVQQVEPLRDYVFRLGPQSHVEPPCSILVIY